MIFFDEKEHKYKNKLGESYISTTQFISRFYTHFEETEKFWLLYKAIQYCSQIDKPAKIKKYDLELDQEINSCIFTAQEYARIIQYTFRQCNKNDALLRSYFSYKDLLVLDVACIKIKNHWAKLNLKSTDKGTAFHNWKEDKQFRDGKYTINGTDYKVIQREKINLSNLEVGIHPEVRMWNDQYKLAGTADQVVVLPGRKILIRDFKTNIELKYENKYEKMLDPISHLDNCNIVHYNIQLSIYGWMLEQFGYECLGLEIEHYDLKEEGNKWRIQEETAIPLQYMKNTVLDMLKHGGHNRGV